MFVGLVFLSSQVALLRFGDDFVRLWDVTEYKEFMIPVALLVYALEILHRATSEPAADLAEQRFPQGTEPIGTIVVDGPPIVPLR